MPNKNPNLGHRQRLRDEFITNHNNISKEKVLELLLFSGVPMKDTRLLAKNILEKVDGSFVKLFNKDSDFLESELKLTKSVISTILAIRRAMTIYNTEEFIDDKKIDSIKEMAAFFQREIGGKETEYIMILFLNNSQNVVGKKIYGDKNIINVSFDVADIIATAQNVKARFIIMSHNHPSGNVSPSSSDIVTTNNFYEAVKFMKSFIFLDHIIVSPNKYFSFSGKNMMPNSREIKSLFSDNQSKVADNDAIFKIEEEDL